MAFDLTIELPGQIQGQTTRYPISSRNYVIRCINIVSNDSQPASAAYTTITLDLTFELPGQIQGQRTGYLILSRNYVSKFTKMVSKDSYPP